jgi:uncharacterized protein (DUF2062 family)
MKPDSWFMADTDSRSSPSASSVVVVNVVRYSCARVDVAIVLVLGCVFCFFPFVGTLYCTVCVMSWVMRAYRRVSHIARKIRVVPYIFFKQ